MATAKGAVELYVSGEGDDRWSGRLARPAADGKDGPFATPARARRAVREMRRQGPLRRGATVSIRGGAYFLDSPLILTAADSGGPGAPIVWRGYGAEGVGLAGGSVVSGWRRHSGKVLVADVDTAKAAACPDLGWNLHEESSAPNVEVFYRGRRMDPARWPKRKEGDPHGGGWAYISHVEGDENFTTFTAAALRGKRWTNLREAQVHLFPNYDWADDFRAIESFDPKTGTITLAGRVSYALRPGRRFYVRHVFEELSRPGEWYLDREAGRLYFVPPEGLLEGDVVISRLDSVIVLRNVRHVTVRGLTIECSRASAVRVEGGEHCRVVGCTIRNAGVHAVRIEGGQGHEAAGCDLYDLGRSGVWLGGGDRRKLTRGGHAVDNCHIHHYGRLAKCYSAGVRVFGVGNRVAHCDIHDAPHNAILLGGNDHVIEYNHIHHVIREGSDTGAFYMGRDWSEQGNVIRFNCFHDILGYGCQTSKAPAGYIDYESPGGAWAVYLDDCASGTRVYGNLFYRVPMGALHLGGGKDNVFENNVVVGSIPSVHVDARWAKFCYDVCTERLKAVKYRRPPYRTRYPRLVGYLDGNVRLPARTVIRRNIVVYADDNFRGFWKARRGRGIAVLWELRNWDPATSHVDRNLVWHDGHPVRVDQNEFERPGGVIGWREWQGLGFDRESLVVDPEFLNPAEDDFRLRGSSPALGMGFKPIPLGKIGMYRSRERASWPVAVESRPLDTRIVRRRVRLGRGGRAKGE